MDIKKVRKQVTISGALLAMASGVPFAFLRGVPAGWPIILLANYLLIAAHWWLLAKVISALLSNERTMTVLWGMVAFFPLAMAFALCFVAVKIDRFLIMPAVAGIASVPLAATLYCIYAGLKSLLHRQ
jgi:hypothetical protein